jgi:hypothetical protein
MKSSSIVAQRPSSNGRSNVVRVPGQFDPLDKGIVVATPSCCCCCCCCMVTLSSGAAYTMGIAIRETRQQNDPKKRRALAGFLGMVATILIYTSGFVGWFVSHRFMKNDFYRVITAAVFMLLAAFPAHLLLARWASRGTRGAKKQLKETILFVIVGIPAFVGEFISFGIAIFGQALAFLLPFLVGNARAKLVPLPGSEGFSTYPPGYPMSPPGHGMYPPGSAVDPAQGAQGAQGAQNQYGYGPNPNQYEHVPSSSEPATNWSEPATNRSDPTAPPTPQLEQPAEEPKPPQES